MVRWLTVLGWVFAFSACGGESRRSVAGAGGSAGQDPRLGGTTAATTGDGIGQAGDKFGTGGSSDVSTAGGPATSAGGDNGIAATGGSATSVGGAGDAGAPLEPTESIGDDEQTMPASPAGFFWWAGLGNWFVCALPNKFLGDAHKADIVPPRDDSHQAFRLQGSGQELGEDLWVQLQHPNGGAVDLSAYAGIAFWARLDGASDHLTVGLSPNLPSCSAGSNTTTDITVPNTWQRFELPFEDFGSDGHAVADIEFIVGAGGGDFDLWVDDLSLLCRAECPTHS